MQITKKLSHNHKQNIWMLKILFEIIDDRQNSEPPDITKK